MHLRTTCLLQQSCILSLRLHDACCECALAIIGKQGVTEGIKGAVAVNVTASLTYSLYAFAGFVINTDTSGC